MEFRPTGVAGNGGASRVWKGDYYETIQDIAVLSLFLFPDITDYDRQHSVRFEP